jgi:hypothetical protein
VHKALGSHPNTGKKKKKKDRHVEKPSDIAGRNIKGCSHFGSKFGSFLKN